MLTVMTGRSRRLWPCVVKEIGSALKEKAERLFLLTPDQYTLQAELELIDRLQLPGLLNIEVFSPSRLLTRVFSLAGSPYRVRIDSRGKAMVLADLLRSSRKELSVYRNAYDRNGLVEKLSACIGELKRSGMRPEDIAALADRLDQHDLLHGKLSDIALLYDQYEKKLEGAFLDGDDVQEALLSRLPESGLLVNAQIWIFGFDLISPQFLRQIAVMTQHALSVRLALTLDDMPSRDQMIFQPARDTLARLARYFDREQMLWDKKHIHETLHASPEICHLERELFAIPIVPYDKDLEAVELWSAATPYDEAARAAEIIIRFAREGTRFDQMAVIVGDMNAYIGPVEAMFSRCDIPYHLVRKRRALSHPLIYGFLSALRCVTHGFRMEDSILWLKSGFCGLSTDEAQKLENYTIEHGLSGRKWRRVIENRKMETLRSRFMEPLDALSKNLRESKDITALLTAAYQLLEDVYAYDTLLVLQHDLTERGLLIEASECAQAWKLLLETLDQMQTLLRLDRPAMASISGVLEAGLSTVDLGTVPSWPGMLQIGELGHMKLGGTYQVVLLLGMQDGVMQAAQDGLLSDAEIMKALEHTDMDAAFGLTGDALAQLKQINLLDIIAAPIKKLVVSHSLAGSSGEALRPAVILKMIRKVFPSLTEQSGVTRMLSWVSRKAALDELGPAIQEAVKSEIELPEDVMVAAAWLLHHEDTCGAAANILHLLESPPPKETLSINMANRLYAKSRTTASRLETFAQCPFQHYILYGLNPAIRKEFAVAAEETGMFYHRAMEGYTLAAQKHLSWPDITREESNLIMDSVLTLLQAEWECQPLGDNAMLRAKGDAFCKVARRVAWNYTSQMRRGKFHTHLVEARFGHGEPFPPVILSLPDGNDVDLQGRIDRIDFFEEKGKKWLRVIDYKSGHTGLEPAKIYGSVQLQLFIYLQAALLAYPGTQAAGAFYSYFRDPLIELDCRDVNEIERRIDKELQLSGIQLSDPQVVKALENAGRYLNKDGTINKTAHTASAEQLDMLMEYALMTAVSLAEHIRFGEIAPQPATQDQWNACNWCGYQCICRFDTSIPGNQPRFLQPIKYKELLEEIKKALER